MGDLLTITEEGLCKLDSGYIAGGRAAAAGPGRKMQAETLNPGPRPL